MKTYFFLGYFAFILLCNHTTELPQNKLVKFSHLSNGCSQEYKFFFKNKHDDTFWIGENLYGECGTSSLIQVFIDNKAQIPTAKVTELRDFDSWTWLETAQRNVQTDEAISLNAENGQIIFPSMKFKIAPPPNNVKLQTLKQNEFHDECAKIWNKQMGKNGIDMPIMEGFKANLLYHYTGGLYFNYYIDKVYIFPQSRYMVLFTKNKQKCETSGTTHGFMILSFEMPK
jgi:hypothetical protein